MRDLALQLAIALALLHNTLLVSSTVADEGIEFFEQKIRPVLVANCYECHSEKAEKLKGNLFLDTKAGWERGGDSGQSVIVPGAPEDSLLLQSLKHEKGLEMPPSGQLSEAIINDFATWIKIGAPDPRDEMPTQITRADRSWWSLQPLARSEPSDLPETDEQPRHVDRRAWQKSIIDRFVWNRLAAEGLTPNPPADARTLIRRLFYDVIGLPPTYEQVEEFRRSYEQDPDLATAELVDRLLASTHYGEQWGRHWLDVVRFGESNGFERNVIIDDLWPFRDYVIRSLNDDKPFNQFIVEHLAGDVVGKGNPDIEVGSAFLVAGPYDDVGNQDVVAQANIRAATLDDIITATSSAFLGLTINCARCHDHKFDPIPTEDYCRLRSAFEGVTHGRRVVASTEEQARFTAAKSPLEHELAAINEEINKLQATIRADSSAIQELNATLQAKFEPTRTEESFTAIKAKFVLIRFLAHTSNPTSAVGARLTEVQVWDETNTHNVASQEGGSIASGAKSAVADDFPEAYGAQFTNDGDFAAQWFIGHPAELKISFPQTESIHRVVISNSRSREGEQGNIEGDTPCEYEIFTSTDGLEWVKAADSFDREPFTESHAIERLRREVIGGETALSDQKASLRQLYEKLVALQTRQAGVQQQLNAIPPLRQMWVGSHHQPGEPTRVHVGGDPMKPAEVVHPASLDVLSATAETYRLPEDADEGERRLALAKWIVADSNPLTPRVLANRVWQHHFGAGLVDTPNDFGFLGGQPTHPDLLDWLAIRLQQHNWHLKPLHRDILLSQTYRQSSESQIVAYEKDSEARLLWRFPPRRLSAEEIRDTMLTLGSVLRHDSGGPGFRLYKFTQNNVCTYFPLDQHGPETYRRAVYHQNARASVVDLLSDFDLPDNSFSVPKRSTTTSPLQALTMLNHAFTIDMAKAFASRSVQESNADIAASIQAAYRIGLQRTPSDEELRDAVSIANAHGLESFCRALLNFNELLFVE